MDKYVLYIGNFPLPDKGASSQRVISNAKIIKSLGYKPIIVGFEKELEKDNQRSFSFHGIDFISHNYPISTKQWLLSLIDIKQIVIIINNILASGNEVNCVIAYNYSAIALNRLRKYLKKNNIKCYGDCTEWYDTAHLIGIKKLAKKLDTSFRMRYVQKKLDGLIVISTYLENYYKKQRTILIPPLVDREFLPKNVEQYKKFTISYCGAPFAKDKLDLIVDLVSNIEFSVNLIVAGVTKEQFIDQYKYKKNISDNITFMGRVSHEESLLIMAKSHYSCFFRENTRKSNAGFSTKFVESISVGTPVITNDTSDLSYWIDKLDAGTIVKDFNSFNLDLLNLSSYISYKRISKYNILQFSSDNELYITEIRKLLTLKKEMI